MNYVKKFIRDLSKMEGNIYLVGGYIRDKLINPKIQPEDADFIYDGDIVSLIKNLNQIGYKFFPIKKEIDIYRCMIGNNTIDISKINGKNIVEDLKERDFTVNAICMKLGENKIIDPFDGRKALKNRIIKMVTMDSLNNDPIRILRAIRIYISYGMHFNLDTENMIEKSAYKLKNAPKERVLSELMLIIKKDEQGNAFEILDTFSILKNLIPYVQELKTVGKCKYHIEDVFTHSNLTYKVFKDVIKKRIVIKKLDYSIFDVGFGKFTMKEYAAFACFVHDIGKYKAYKKENNKVSFLGHEEIGADICKNICNNLKFPKKASKFIETVVGAHMYPLYLFKNNRENKEAYFEFFYKYNEFAMEIILISFCDNYATRILLDEENEKEEYSKFIEDMFSEYKIYVDIRKNKLIDGNDIINILGNKGPLMTDIIKDIYKLIYTGKIKTREESIQYINKLK
ncbi:poly(A) polymerase [Clostridium algifaecis]|uniref:Poly(A) polymerase n=1 Tax=Clostridium algifaecis TaxID=1472040 RepID=A0ABS4KQH0_9CLOT|nr:HD domain-containing protein [Clostridium algifaecis]MBP2032298.1 poly(A) polymerase [Clostridium algifaecis]